LDLRTKKNFANDKENYVSSCYRINSSKDSATPKDFLRRSNNKNLILIDTEKNKIKKIEF